MIFNSVSVFFEIIKLKRKFNIKRLKKREIGTDDVFPAQAAFHLHIGFAEGRFSHVHAVALVGMPYRLAPMHSRRVEGATEIEDISFYVHTLKL